MRRRRSRSYSRNGFDDIKGVDWKRVDLIKFEKNFYKELPAVTRRSRHEISKFHDENDISTSEDAPKPIFTFDEAGFPSCILKGIKENKWTKPTPIQSQGWPIALSGSNVVGIAQTGSGKTASFLLPAIVHIEAQPPLKSSDGPICLVLVPTRELAQQVEKVASEFTGYANIRTACCYGGAARRGQILDLERKPEIVIATPGRLLDFIKDRKISLLRCTYLVLDEADRMLDMGFEPDIRRIMSQLRPDRQTLMWSATWPKEVQQLASEFLGRYIQVNVGSLQLHANPDIDQKFEFVEESSKEDRMLKVLRDHKRKRTLVFVETKRKVDELASLVERKGLYCGAMHGDKAQRDREKVLNDFRSGRCYVLIATDVASRGLDIDDVEYVINYDYPSKAEDYIHRIGRTGRSGKKGVAYTFFNPIKEKPKHASHLIRILEEAKQNVPKELRQIATGRFRLSDLVRHNHNRSRSISRRRSRSHSRRRRSHSRNRRTRSPPRRNRRRSSSPRRNRRRHSSSIPRRRKRSTSSPRRKNRSRSIPRRRSNSSESKSHSSSKRTSSPPKREITSRNKSADRRTSSSSASSRRNSSKPRRNSDSEDKIPRPLKTEDLSNNNVKTLAEEEIYKSDDEVNDKSISVNGLIGDEEAPVLNVEVNYSIDKSPEHKKENYNEHESETQGKIVISNGSIDFTKSEETEPRVIIPEPMSSPKKKIETQPEGVQFQDQAVECYLLTDSLSQKVDANNQTDDVEFAKEETKKEYQGNTEDEKISKKRKRSKSAEKHKSSKKKKRSSSSSSDDSEKSRKKHKKSKKSKHKHKKDKKSKRRSCS